MPPAYSDIMLVAMAFPRIRGGIILAGLVALGPLLGGCGGASALMHPAHTLPFSEISLGTGVAQQWVRGDARNAIDSAASANAPGSAPADVAAKTALARGAAAAALLSPGLSPWLGARVGIGQQTEGGLVFTGRTARLDVRHAFERESVALSIGLGASTKLADGNSAEATSVRSTGGIPGVDAGGVRGFGADLPILVGWRSTGGIVQGWMGVRGGFERLSGDVVLQLGPGDPTLGSLDGSRWYVGGLVGLMVGVSPIWAALELNGAYQKGSGTLDANSGPSPFRAEGSLTGLTLAPTAALLTRF